MQSDFKKVHNIVVDAKFAPDKILAGAKNELVEVALIGIDRSGHLYLASSHKIQDAITLVERGLKDLKGRME